MFVTLYASVTVAKKSVTFSTVCSRENFSQLIQELRRAHGGSLSGMSLEVILTRVTQMAIARGFKHIGNGEVSTC